MAYWHTDDDYVEEVAHTPVDVSRIYIGFDGRDMTAHCPSCYAEVTQQTCNYCPKCGCKLNWRKAKFKEER